MRRPEKDRLFGGLSLAPFGAQELVERLYGYLQLLATGLGGGQVLLDEVADSDRETGPAKDKPGLAYEDELEDDVGSPVDKRVRQRGEDDVDEDVGATAGVEAAHALRAFQGNLAVLLVGGDSLVLGTMIATDGGELHGREEEQEDRQDREGGEEAEHDPQRSTHGLRPEVQEDHDEPEDSHYADEGDEHPDRAQKLQEDTEPEKDRTYHGPVGDARQDAFGLPEVRGVYPDVDLAVPALGRAAVVRPEEVYSAPASHAAEEEPLFLWMGFLRQDSPSARGVRVPASNDKR